MALEGQGTRRGRLGVAIQVQIEGIELDLSKWETRHLPPGQVISALRQLAHEQGVTLPSPIFVHRNEDGHLALAFGVIGGTFVWPEEERRQMRLARAGEIDWW